MHRFALVTVVLHTEQTRLEEQDTWMRQRQAELDQRMGTDHGRDITRLSNIFDHVLDSGYGIRVGLGDEVEFTVVHVTSENSFLSSRSSLS